MLGPIKSRSFAVSPFLLFIIGLSAGLISAVFPRLMTMLAVMGKEVDLTLFSIGFLIAAAAFSLIIGVAMVWLYMGTSESTRNLFMAALAVPAVLSGGLNMTNATSAGQKNLRDMAAQNQELTDKLLNNSSIPIVPSVKLSGFAPLPPVGIALHQIFEVSRAQAAEDQLAAGGELNPGVTFQVKEQRRDYVILFDSSTNLSEIHEKLEQLKRENIPGVDVGISGNTHYLYQKIPKSKSQAVLDAIELREKHPEIRPSLMKIE